ncbi:hypothetical protein HRbin15_00678 [bacterium HR15]|nr:hypothetical protein HRbin15_00678 [bacterium HR15]
MRRPIIRLRGCIQSLSFRGQPVELTTYDWERFDINTASRACKVRLPSGTEIALSKWTGPKRTRTYPLAKVYDTYSHGGKIVTVIPIIKDEGKGERRNDTNLDRLNFITLSWMNLMNIYVVLAWYCDAKKKDRYRITDQILDNSYVRQMIEQIDQYKMDAHHWNHDHFVHKFIPIYEKALQSYDQISQRLEVDLHDKKRHAHFLDLVRESEDSQCLDLQKYAEQSLPASLRAALREAETQHLLERTQGGVAKGFLEIRNYLGGVYYLTADEIIFESPQNIIIQESKNSTKQTLPSVDDIKDGLFKLLLYSQLQKLWLVEKEEDIPLQFSVRLRLTGKFAGTLYLPEEAEQLQSFAKGWGRNSIERLKWLNDEIQRMGIKAVLEGSDD